MNNTIIGYETQHGSARKCAKIISEYLNIKCVNIDTPFMMEDLSKIDNVILVFNFRGPYTAQLTKLYLERVKNSIKDKNVFLIGEGLFSEKEFPVVAEETRKICGTDNFKTFFIKGQLRVETLTEEERDLLGKFSELTGMEIKDMGQFDENAALDIAKELKSIIESNTSIKVEVKEESKSETKWVCPVCGYVHTGDNPPEKCPLCGVPGTEFYKQN